MFMPADKKSVKTPALQTKSRLNAGVTYLDDQRHNVSQRQADKNPLQRKLTMKGDFEGAVFDDETDDDTLNDFIAELMSDDPELESLGREKIFTLVRQLANEGDHTLYPWEIKDRLNEKPSDEQLDEEEEESDEEEEDEESDEEEATGSNTIMIGKREFDRGEWHHTVKETIKRTITNRKLSKLAYGDYTHHNFDFWIAQDGRIWVGGNNTGGHEKQTDFVLTEANKVEKIDDEDSD